MRDVNYGYLIRYIHANGASFFFICMYAHIGKALYYGSYKSPRVLVWVIGVIIFILTMATAFLGKQTQHCPKSLYNRSNNFNKIKNKQSLISKRSFHTTTNQDIRKPKDILNKLGIKVEDIWDNLHLSATRENILQKVKNRSGIYIIINKITGQKYIGSAITNKLHVRFANHCIHSNHGSKLVKKSIKEFGLNNFMFGILEYIDEITTNENNKDLLNLEQFYLDQIIPELNILKTAGNSFGYTHSEETLIKMKESYTEERKDILRKFQENRKGKWSEESKNKISLSNISRLSHLNLNTEEELLKRSNRFSKTIYLKLNNNIVCEFKNINQMCNYICCSEKTIRRSIKLGYIFIPILYTPYLQNKCILKYNNVKDNHPSLKNINKKSGLVFKDISLKEYEVSRSID